MGLYKSLFVHPAGCSNLGLHSTISSVFDYRSRGCNFESQVPVVQSIVSFESSLVVKMLTVLVSTISISQAFLLNKCEYLLHLQKLLTFFSAKILAYMPYLMIKVLTIRQLTTSLVLNNWAQVGHITCRGIDR